MADKYMEAIDAGSAFLEHHGILGMHWGVRRTPAQLGYKKAQRTKAKQEKAAARKEKIMRDPKLLSKHAKEFTDAELVQAYNRFRTQEAISQYAQKPKKEKKEHTQSPKPAKDSSGKDARRLEKLRAKNERKQAKLNAKIKAEEEQRKAERDAANKSKKSFKQRIADLSSIAGSTSNLLAKTNAAGISGRAFTDEMGLTDYDPKAPSWWSGIINPKNLEKLHPPKKEEP